MELTKVSILLFYLRIFPRGKFHTITFALIALFSCSALAFIIVHIVQCIPLQHNWLYWRGNSTHGKCIDINLFAYIVGTSMIVKDIVIIILPMPWIINLNTSVRNRLGTMVMFSMGIFICATSCIRTTYLVLYARTVNPTWDYTDLFIWSALEVDVSIIVVNLPAIRILIRKKVVPVLHKMAGKRASKGSQDTGLSLPGHTLSRSSKETFDGVSNLSFDKERDATASTAICGRKIPLELGDKIKGEVQTRISVGSPPASAKESQRISAGSCLRHTRGNSGASEILVETTTTRTVDHG